MTFFLDHDAPHDLTYSLRALGHEVVVLRDVLPITVDDATVLHYAAEHGYVVITCNRDDFVAEAQNVTHAGIIRSSAAKPALPNEPPSSASSTAPVKPG